jgi:hypothetical protein
MSGEARLREGECLVFDTSVLSAFAEAEQFDLLGRDTTNEFPAWARKQGLIRTA